MLNSSLFYEISVLRPSPRRSSARSPTRFRSTTRRGACLSSTTLIPIAPDEILPMSILREFIGGSSFGH